MLDVKRELNEVIAIYTFEKDLVNIYVEGSTDKLIIDNYFEYVKSDKYVTEINDIDFSKEQGNFPGLDLKSNKNKLIALSILLTNNKIDSKIKCIIDRDFDGILTPVQKDLHILYTDYSCMESYICCQNNIKKILNVGIKNFPHNTDLVIEEISKVISILFIIRMINEKFKLGIQCPKIENHISVDKKTGICNIDLKECIVKYINTNKLSHQKEEILAFTDEIIKILPIDVRFKMNGHDFIEVLFHYINKIKNTANFKLNNFERAVYLSIQPNYLDDYRLFEKLKE